MDICTFSTDFGTCGHGMGRDDLRLSAFTSAALHGNVPSSDTVFVKAVETNIPNTESIVVVKNPDEFSLVPHRNRQNVASKLGQGK